MMNKLIQQINSNDKMNDILKIVKSLEDSAILLK